MFMTDPLHRFPPVLSLVFTKINCKNIFDDWIKNIGYSDGKNLIGIRIIKGIDKEHPYWHRVAVGQQGFVHSNVKKLQLMAMTVRCHTMEPNNVNNLKIFEKELQ